MVGMDSHGHNGAGKSPSIAGRLGLSLFFLFFLALGSLFESFLVREFGRALGQRSWARVPCTVVSSEVQEQGGNRTPYVFAVSYRYEHASRSYAGSKFERNDSGSDKYSGAHSVARRYAAGASLFCYVSPGNLGEAVLQRYSLAIGVACFFPLIFVLIGAGGIYWMWRRKRPEKEKPIAATALQKGGKGLGKHGLAILFAVFAVAGGLMLYPLGIRPIARTIAAESWVATPCKVLRAEVRSHDSDDGTTYNVYILYQYEFHGQTYESDRYEFVGGSSSGYQGKARVVEQYQAATNPICYVNPNDPSEAVLKRGFHAKLLLALLPLPFLLIGVGGLAGTLRGNKVPGGGTVLPGLAQRPVRASDDIAVLRATDSNRVVLTPKFPPKAKFLGLTVIALVWNGIVLAFVASVANGFRHGDPSWVGLLVLLPFGGIGLVLAGSAVYQFLALFNPRSTLELSSSVLPLGAAAELSWSFSGQTSRIDEFTVTLRGVEEAKYRKGTSTCTDRSTFYEMELYRTANAGEIASGQVGFVLPPDTMHSFEAENNKILWSLDIHGRIKGWPDVKETFKITVTPVAG